MSYRRIFTKILKHKRFIKFFISGSFSALVNLSSLFLLHGIWGVQVVVSASISFVLAFLVNFYLQKFWTFSSENKGRLGRQMIQHFSVGIFDLIVNAGGIYLLVEKLAVWYLLAQVILSLVLAFVNYFLYKLIFISTKAENDNYTSKKKIKKILIATGIYPPDSGGPATYSKILKKELPKHDFKIKVVSYGERKKNDKQNGVYRISRKQNLFARYFQYFKQVWRLAKWADLVYVQGPVSEGLPSYFACRLRRKKYILKVVGDFAWEQGQQRFGVEELLDEFQNKNYSWQVELWRLVEIFVSNGAWLVIVPSEYLKKIVSLWGVKKEKIKVIYNSVEDIKILGDKSNLDLNIDLRHPALVSAGRLVPWKGFDVLMEAIAMIKNDGQDIFLYIAGSGPDENILREKAQSLNLASRVKFLGKLEQKKLWQYMKEADIFILNTAYEGLSHLLIEAMALEVPIITTKVGGNKELIKNGQSGILIDYNDKEQIVQAIKKILDNKEIAQDFTKKARQKSFDFSKEKMINSLLKVLEKGEW